jgi:wobble nucleotide-excising tRNase
MTTIENYLHRLKDLEDEKINLKRKILMLEEELTEIERTMINIRERIQELSGGK